MSNQLPTPRDIERWVPSHFDQIIGCKMLKEHLADHLRMDSCGVNTLVFGEPGSGKTAAVKAYVRSLMCPFLDKTTLIPCGHCNACRTFDVRYEDSGLFTLAQDRVANGLSPINFFPVNCGAVTESQLRDLLDSRPQYDGRYLIYLDEVHRIIRRKMDHMLLKPLEELDATWIASTARPTELDPMFLRRFSAKTTTEPPTTDELVRFLEARCTEFSIEIESQSVLSLLARKCCGNTSKAMSVVAISAGRQSRRLTRDLVVQFAVDL